MSKDIRIVFMGTPQFAVESLKTLVDAKYNVVAVVTATDKAAGRGKKIMASPVKEYAINQSIPILQPLNLKSPEFIEELASFKADLFVVVAFRMLPEVVWSMPGKGCINLHASLLPDYRGAAPINWAIINGETKSGVSTFFIEKEIDTGKIIHQESVDISASMTAGELHDVLAIKGAQLLLKTIDGIEKNEIKAIAQDTKDKTLNKAPKIYREDCRINWDNKCTDVYNLIRGMSPYPASWSILKVKKEISIKIIRADYEVEEHNYTSGTIILEGKKRMKVAAKGGWIILMEIIPQGKSKMDIASFLNGYNYNEGDHFE